MRARGAQVTDIVVLIIAADDSVMPQTLEALNHAQAAEVPVIVAINKIDKPETDIERIKQQLSEQNVLVESWGGKYPSVDVSAKTGQGIDELLETILIQAELLELKVSPNGRTRGFVIESRVEKAGEQCVRFSLKTEHLNWRLFCVRPALWQSKKLCLMNVVSKLRVHRPPLQSRSLVFRNASGW